MAANDTKEYQGTLKMPSEKGVYICICSKNNDKNINAMFSGDIPLKLSDITITKFNVSDKLTAIKGIASELGISTDSIVDHEHNACDDIGVVDLDAVRGGITHAGHVAARDGRSDERLRCRIGSGLNLRTAAANVHGEVQLVAVYLLTGKSGLIAKDRVPLSAFQL